MKIVTNAGRFIAVFLGGIVAFGESVDSATTGKVAEWIMGAYYMVRVEIFLFIIIAAALPAIVRTVRSARESVQLLPKLREAQPGTYKLAVTLLIVSVVLSLVLVSATASYVVMKVAFVRGYGDFLLNKSFREYRRGRTHRARLLLAACSRVLDDERCGSELAMLDERLACASLLRKLHDRMSFFNAQRVELEDSIVSLDHDFKWHKWQRERYVQELARLRRLYSGAIDELKSGHTARAVALLRALEQAAPGFGSCDDLMREVTNDGAAKPLSDTARGMATHAFVMRLTSWMDPHDLVQNRRAEWVYASTDVVPIAPAHDEMAMLIGF